MWILISAISQWAKPRPREVAWLAQGHPATGGLSGIQTRVCLAPQNGPSLPAPPAEARGGSAHLTNVSQAETSDGCPVFSPLELWAPFAMAFHEPICPWHGSTFQWGRRLPDFAASSSFGLELDSSSSLGSRAGPGMQAVSSLPSPSSLHDEVADGWGKLDVQSVPRLPEVFGEQGICWGGGTCLYEMV